MQQAQEREGFLIVHLPDSNMYDVFAGKGWQNWSRVLVKADFVRVIKGDKIPAKTLYKLFEGEQREKFDQSAVARKAAA